MFSLCVRLNRVLLLVGALSVVVEAELIVSEVMYDPASAEDRWEWIEVHNTGAVAIDLDGYVIDRVGDRERLALSPNIVASLVYEQRVVDNPTVVPAGGIAVLYNGPGLGYDPDRFRAAWPETPVGTRLIGVNGWSSNQLTNSPTASDYAPSLPAMTVGFWADEASYRLDAIDFGTPAKPDRRVFRTQNAAATFGYDDNPPWRDTGGVASLIYLGGDPLTPTSWGRTNPPWGGAVVSRTSYIPEAVNAPDFGSPGIAPPGGLPADGLLITELMYDPASTTGVHEWEWLEVYNSGPAIDFAASPHWLDDDDGSDLAEANVASGSIGRDQSAVLFNADVVTVEQIREAWDRPGVAAINWIAVESWPTLANGGDLVGLWESEADYAGDRQVEAGSIAAAAAGVVYGDSRPWPTGVDGESIRLTNLASIPNDPSSWSRARGPFGDPDAYQSAEVTGRGEMIDNSGEDHGNPGFIFPDIVSPIEGDYNGDGLVNAADYTLWRDGLPLPHETATAGTTDTADYEVWRRHYRGEIPATVAVPEPTTFIVAMAVAGLMALGGRWFGLVS